MYALLTERFAGRAGVKELRGPEEVRVGKTCM